MNSPQVKVPAGSVGLGGRQCCIYPIESPGGYWLLGRTPLALYDPRRADPILLRAGDRVRFRAIHRAEFDRIAARGECGPPHPWTSSTRSSPHDPPAGIGGDVFGSNAPRVCEAPRVE